MRRAFLEARFQTVQNPEGSSADVETWQVWCKGSYGRMVGIVEVTATKLALPLACMRAAYNRLGLIVEVSRPTAKDKDGNVKTLPGVTLAAKPDPKREQRRKAAEAALAAAKGDEVALETVRELGRELAAELSESKPDGA